MIETLRKFLKDNNVFEEFCTAYLSDNGMDSSSDTGTIIDSFTWSVANDDQRNDIPWGKLHGMWCNLHDDKRLPHYPIEDNERKAFIEELRGSKILKLKRYVNALP